MSRWNDAMLRKLIAEVSDKGSLTTEQAFRLLADLRDQFVPMANIPQGKFLWDGHIIELGYTVRGSRVVFDEMVAFEGVVTKIAPYIVDEKLSALLDVATKDYTDWLGCGSLVLIKDLRGNIIWQAACVHCRKPAMFLNGNFMPVCEYCV